jgi:YidC/Oxa1 family membrane protein insertase
MVDGSIRLQGAKLDDLRLKTYHFSIDPKSPEIVLLAPKSTDYPYYADFGWVGEGVVVPGDDSVWKQTGGGILSPGKPVTLTWDNGQGLVFTRVIAVDDKYMFTVADSVANSSGRAVTLYPYGAVERQGIQKDESSSYLHVGFVGVANGKEQDAKYSDFKDSSTPPKSFSSTGGWVGITDKYWMAAAIPPQNEAFDGQYLGTRTNSGVEAYQASYRLTARKLAVAGNVSATHRLFAGAKVVDILRGYQDGQKIVQFDNAVDWGMMFFLTRPFFWILDYLYKLLGNFGLAILGLTVAVKLLFFPLQSASFRSMSKIKKLQPEMERLKKHHEGDAQKYQLAVMELYKREKANPVAGCVPILLTIPVFIALFKVLFISIEMRQAPFYGWIHDLSAPDPTSIINLFGLLPFSPHAVLPSFLWILSIGVWPILYGITMWVQQKLNPAPTDPVQAKMFTFMPLIFTFVFGNLAAGLVIYYTWSNLLNMLQQSIIMRREGVEIHLFKNLRLKKPKNDG